MTVLQNRQAEIAVPQQFPQQVPGFSQPHVHAGQPQQHASVLADDNMVRSL
jgi:hypothetical protein